MELVTSVFFMKNRSMVDLITTIKNVSSVALKLVMFFVFKPDNKSKYEIKLDQIK